MPASTALPTDQNDTSQKRKSVRPLLGLKPYLARYRGMVWVAIIALITSALTMLAVPKAVQRMIDFGFGVNNANLINNYFLALIGLGVVLAIAAATRVYAVNWLGERVVADLRSDTFARLASLGPAYFEQNHSGEMMSRLTADTTQLKSAAGSSLSQAARNAIMLIGSLSLMVVTSPRLSSLVLLAIPVIVLPLMGWGRSVRELSRKAQDSLAEASAYAAENLSAHRTMQAFGFENVVSSRFAIAVERAFEAARARLKARAGLTGITIFLAVTSVTAILWYGASSVISGEMTGGQLSQFLFYALLAAGALAELAEVWGEMSQAAGAAERLSEILAEVPQIRSPAVPKPLPEPSPGTVEFDAVSFAYPNRPQTSALNGISFKISRGETVALVGPSGAGKSTIFNLLLRFYDPTRGAVRVDGVKTSDADLDKLRARTAIVPQDVALFAGSVADNIGYGSEHASRASIEKAAIAAQADEFIRALPQGYDTKLGERGVTLSGGQRQRLAIARAVLRDAPILLLDEATSALDAENEGQVQRALETVSKGRTTLVIAHRLATVQKADRILVMEDGRITEQGTHAELVRKGGVYARLAALQFRQEAAE